MTAFGTPVTGHWTGWGKLIREWKEGKKVERKEGNVLLIDALNTFLFFFLSFF